MKKRRRAKRTADVDITSLIDVQFMLIIFFVITTSFVRGAADVSLPGGTPPPMALTEPVVITVTKDSQVFWGAEMLSGDDLALRVAAAVAESADILIAGDKDARYGKVAELMDMLRRQGVSSVGLAFEGGN